MHRIRRNCWTWSQCYDIASSTDRCDAYTERILDVPEVWRIASKRRIGYRRDFVRPEIEIAGRGVRSVLVQALIDAGRDILVIGVVTGRDNLDRRILVINPVGCPTDPCERARAPRQ